MILIPCFTPSVPRPSDYRRDLAAPLAHLKHRLYCLFILVTVARMWSLWRHCRCQDIKSRQPMTARVTWGLSWVTPAHRKHITLKPTLRQAETGVVTLFVM